MGNKGTAIIVVVVCIILGSAVFFLSRHLSSQSPAASQSLSQPTPTIKTTDLAPGIADNQKTAVEVMHGDSSYEKFIVANSILPNFLNSLPKDDRIISQTPLGPQ